MTYYDSNAERLFAQDQSVSTEIVHRDWLDLLPDTPGSVCDIGAGSGRDSGWLAGKGWQVTAVEPCERLRILGEAFTSQLSHLNIDITWLNDSLPNLDLLVATSRKFDLIILSAVWMHLPVTQHIAAMATLKSLLDKSGLLIISLRNGPDPEKRFFKTSIDELIETANSQSLQLLRGCRDQKDANRPEISWDSAVFTLIDSIGNHGDKS